MAKLPITGKLQFAEFPSRSTPMVAAYRGPRSMFSPRTVFNSASVLAVSNALLVNQISYSGLVNAQTKVQQTYLSVQKLSISITHMCKTFRSSTTSRVGEAVYFHCFMKDSVFNDRGIATGAHKSYSLTTLLEDKIVVKDAQRSDSRHGKYQRRRELPPKTHC